MPTKLRSSMPLRLIFFGPPGVGKGTQARLISEEFGIPHFSTGDILRAAVAAGTDLGTKAKALMDAGQLVPDQIMIGLIREVLASPKAKKGFILDGFPRTLEQAKALTGIFDELNIGDHTVVNFEVDDDEVIRRLANRLVCRKDGRIFSTETDGVTRESPCPDCGGELYQRDDDGEATVRKRLRIYKSTTEPVLHYYTESGVVLNVDGTGSIDVVNREIKLMLEQ